jgi:L-rhamnose mutarotase
MTSAKVIKNAAKLSEANPPLNYLQDPTSIQYAYGYWLYINSWDNNIKKVIIGRDNNFSMYLDNTTPTLYCDITLSDDTKQTITITNNFPIQKWVYVVMSVDGQIVDFYLNGKLVVSQKLTKMQKAPGDTNVPLLLGSSNTWDALISQLTRVSHPMSPQEVMNNYISGYNTVSGGIFNSGANSYNANLKVLKNGEIFADTQLF